MRFLSIFLFAFSAFAQTSNPILNNYAIDDKVAGDALPDWSNCEVITTYPATVECHPSRVAPLDTYADDTSISGPLLAVPFSARLRYSLPNVPLPMFGSVNSNVIWGTMSTMTLPLLTSDTITSTTGSEKFQSFTYTTADGITVLSFDAASGELQVQTGKFIRTVTVKSPNVGR